MGLHQASCRCLLNEEGANICPGEARGACYSPIANISSSAEVEEPACTSCDSYDSEATEATWVAKDSMCDSAVGEVLYFTKGNECGCETPEVLESRYGEQGYNTYTMCAAPENSYATCSVTLDFTSGKAEPGGRGCSFTCSSDYETSPDGTGCPQSTCACCTKTRMVLEPGLIEHITRL